MQNKDIIKQLNKIAIPLIIHSLASLTIGLIDQAMIGKISITGFASVGIVSTILFLLTGIFGCMSIYFNIKGAPHYKNNKMDEFKKEFSNSIFSSIFIGIILTLFLLILGPIIINLIYNLDDEMLANCKTYMLIMSPYFIFQLLVFTFGVYFKITLKTKFIVICGLTTSILNVCLNYLLIFGNFGFPELGVSGAAIASITSLFINVLLCTYIARRDISIKLRVIKDYFKSLKSTLKFSIPLFGEEIVTGTIFTLVITSMITRLGVNEIAAYLIIIQFISIAMIPNYMYGNAMITVISKNDGKKNNYSLKKIVSSSMKVSLSIYVFISLIFILFRDNIPHIITSDNNVVNMTSNIIIMYILVNLFNVLSLPFKYTLNSVGKANFVFISSSIINITISLLIILSVMFYNISIEGLIVLIGINFLLIFICLYLKYLNIIRHKKS